MHFKDDTGKRLHGMFTIPTNELTGLIDDAWDSIQKNNIQPTIDSGGNYSYIVNMGPIGKEGGSLGSQATLSKLQLHFKGNTTQILSAYPIQ